MAVMTDAPSLAGQLIAVGSGAYATAAGATMPFAFEGRMRYKTALHGLRDP